MVFCTLPTSPNCSLIYLLYTPELLEEGEGVFWRRTPKKKDTQMSDVRHFENRWRKRPFLEWIGASEQQSWSIAPPPNYLQRPA